MPAPDLTTKCLLVRDLAAHLPKSSRVFPNLHAKKESIWNAKSARVPETAGVAANGLKLSRGSARATVEVVAVRMFRPATKLVRKKPQGTQLAGADPLRLLPHTMVADAPATSIDAKHNCVNPLLNLWFQ